MPSWLMYVTVAMICGSLSIVLAKAGLNHASEHVALFVRTAILFSFTIVLNVASGDIKNVLRLDKRSLIILIASGIATTIYWFLYYKALKSAPAYQIAAIDKAGIVVTVLLSSIFLNEPVSMKSLLGILLIAAGCAITILCK